MDRDQAGHAAALEIFAAHGVAGALRRDHQHVEVGARIDQVEMHVEAVGEQQRRALLHVVVQMLAIDVALQFVRGQHHHHVGPLGGLGDFHHLEAGGLGLLRGGRALAQRDGDVLDAGILQVQRMGMALAAVADDDDLLALDQIDVGVAIVINPHGRSFIRRLNGQTSLVMNRSTPPAPVLEMPPVFRAAGVPRQARDGELRRFAGVMAGAAPDRATQSGELPSQY